MSRRRDTTPRSGVTKESRRAVVASLFGSAFEWYDFFIYGLLAALVFDQLFFPDLSEAAGTLAALSTFTVGFVGRPLGAMVFGHYGDRMGRKLMMLITLTGMGVVSLLIGLLPTYESIGVAAPILLVTLRFLQGVAIGGEWGGTSLFTVEHAPRERRGFLGSFPQMGIPGGQLLGTSVVFVVTALLSDAQLVAWGWRIPFYLSAILVVIGIYVRMSISESPGFEELQKTGDVSRRPLLELFSGNIRNVLIVAGMHLALSAAFYIGATFVISYGSQEVGISEPWLLGGVAVAQVVTIAALPFFGSLSDRIGRRPVYFIGSLGVAVIAFPYFALIKSGEWPMAWLALVLGTIYAAMMAVQPAFFCELFSARIRFSGVALGYQLGTIIGSLVPVGAAALLNAASGDPWLVAALIAAVGVVSFLASYVAVERQDATTAVG